MPTSTAKRKQTDTPTPPTDAIQRADDVEVIDLEEPDEPQEQTALRGSRSRRDLHRPQLCVLDGNPGPRTAVETSWPGIAGPPCVVHKLRNLERHTPQHAREEFAADYHRITEAESGMLARQAYHAFVAKWEKRLLKVVPSLREAGEERLTCYRPPPSQWKYVRNTNATERLK
jgi:transposase-like protein